MEDYELTMGTIEQYKFKACGLVDGDCNKCQARYKYNNKNWCCFENTLSNRQTMCPWLC